MYAPDRLEAWLLDQLLEQLCLEPPPTAQETDPGDTATAMAELCPEYHVDRIVTRAGFLSARAHLVHRADELSRQAGLRPEAAGPWPTHAGNSVHSTSDNSKTCWPIVLTGS